MGDLKSNLQQQFDELDLLQSMYSAPGEFIVEDQSTYDSAFAFVRGLSSEVPGRLACGLHIPVNAPQPSSVSSDGSACDVEPQYSVEMSIRLPHRYPDVLPEISVSSNELGRSAQDGLNADLQEYIQTCLFTPGEVCLLSAIDWVRENAYMYLHPPSSVPSPTDKQDGRLTPSFCRMWLYMHHIYSKKKRKDILSLADEFGLTGFCLPGKPGVVCIEGERRRTDDFYGILRRWNWKSITCRKREVVQDATNMDALRRIEGFKELVFDTHGHRSNHMDMGQFREYLKEHGMEHIFKELFGIEGHPDSKGSKT